MPSDKSDIIQTGHDLDNEGLYGKWYDCLIKIIVEACGEGNYNLYIADCEVYFKDVILRLLKSEGKILSKMKVTRRKRELGIEPEMSESVQEGLWAEGWRCWRRQTCGLLFLARSRNGNPHLLWVVERCLSLAGCMQASAIGFPPPAPMLLGGPIAWGLSYPTPPCALSRLQAGISVPLVSAACEHLSKAAVFCPRCWFVHLQRL